MKYVLRKILLKKSLIHKITSEAFQFRVETFTFKILKRNIYDNIILFCHLASGPVIVKLKPLFSICFTLTNQKRT